MIFSMDELGFENNEKVMQLSNNQKWEFILSVAKNYGFNGIHVTPSLYQSFGLDIGDMPDIFDEYHLTYHLGGLHRILSDSEYCEFEKLLETAFLTVQKHAMYDISLHPPVIEGYTKEEKAKTKKQFSNLLHKWSKIAKESGFTLSLETHLYKPFFLFADYPQYLSFIEGHKDVGILIDVSHNFFSGYSEDDMISSFSRKQVTALHLSDALRLKDGDIKLGTHLTAGNGKIDFSPILKHYAKEETIFAALEIKASNEELARSLSTLKGILA